MCTLYAHSSYHHTERMYTLYILCIHYKYYTSITHLTTIFYVYTLYVLYTPHISPLQGYALVEFEEHSDALSAIKGLNGKKLLEQVITVDWAFTKK